MRRAPEGRQNVAHRRKPWGRCDENNDKPRRGERAVPAELVLFENQEAYHRFAQANFSFGANASAVALKQGASGSVRFQDGIAVITMPEGGLTAELSISDQKLNYAPLTPQK